MDENTIRQRRTIRAHKENLLGTDGKIGIILKYLGEPIRDHIRSDLDIKEWGFWEDQEEKEGLPTLNEEEDSRVVGWTYDGQKKRLPIYMRYWESDGKMVVDYKGYRVFCEIEGELDCYVPLKEWEDIVENLYVQANKIRKDYNKETEKEMKEMSKIEFYKCMKLLRSKWGNLKLR